MAGGRAVGRVGRQERGLAAAHASATWCCGTGRSTTPARSLGLPAEEVPDEPPDAGIVLFETIRRFKGLERPVVVLCELPETGERLDQLLYTALTRATAHLVVIAPPALAARLRETATAAASIASDADAASDASRPARTSATRTDPR